MRYGIDHRKASTSYTLFSGRNRFIRMEWLFVLLKTGDDEKTDSNDVEAKNKRGLEMKEQMARYMVRV
jgi:hypothetical protein